ncbi:Cytochrome C553 (soluble cytochrome f) [hydrothermal vent metagenome]|uniref:Cytochrome C553 (Soluble cytochrome f) n=1 Tax=hydrothermal vent metagenome TaxID=652676 RepID=A0A1W1BXM8_9ZZZZ
MRKLLISITLLTATTLVADVQAGEKVYKENCAICHTVNGGKALGPDFNMVAYSRHKEDIEKYAKDPYSMYKSFGYSANAMPTLPLEDQQFKDVADYISSLQPFKKWMIKKKPSKKVIVKKEDNNESIEPKA